ncbi:hypothetical protein [Streptomyces roseoverticillatus]|uniref:hypothetical protein n=1 Tax=Streptomyces roseoverticillatus TaxID=66429 RepID=UPI0012FE8760|nr:hypothetical protein [Streptomyces roseoverticillatus]
MSGSSARYGNRAAPGGALRAFFRSWAGGLAPSAERVEDKLISGMQLARTVLGLVAAVWLVAAYPLSGGGQEFVLGKLLELAFSCGILAAGSIIGITAFLIASTPDRRRDFAARLRGPISAALLLAAGPLCIWLSVETLKGDLIDGQDLKDFFSGFTGPGVICTVLAFLALAIGWLAAIAVLLGSSVYTLLATYLCVFTCFMARDVHQLLPALISPLLVWSLFAFQMFNGPDVAAPPEVLYTFMLGGPLSVTALSVWEVRRLRIRHGITLRAALGHGV